VTLRRRPAARQRPRPDAENFDEEVSTQHSPAGPELSSKKQPSISLDLDEAFLGRRFFTVSPSIKKRTPADELPGFPNSYLDQAIRAGSRGERER
jgi:hypothetical protein